MTKGKLIATIKRVSYNQFIDLVETDTAFNKVEEYNAATGTSVVSGSSLKMDSVYERNFEVVHELTPYAIIGRICAQVNNSITVAKLTDEVINEAYIRLTDNFGIPTHLVELDKGNYLLTGIEADSMRLKTLPDDKEKGALIIYTPNQSMLIKVNPYY